LSKNTLREARRYLLDHFKPIHEMPIEGVTCSQVAALLNEIAEGGPYAANRARAALSAFYSWAIGEGMASVNPVVGTNKAGDEAKRDRVLSDDELKSIWNEAGDNDYSAIIRLLILTGQRREEVGGMAWSEVNIDRAIWSIDAKRTKNNKSHDVPLSTAAIEMLRGRTRANNRDLIFGRRDGAFSGWSKSKASLDSRIGNIKPWRLHDIRRTVATRMADLKIQPHVIEALLNHISGHKAGVAGIYNRSQYAEEKRQAVNRWAEHIDSLLEGRASNVVNLRKPK
jgi:integrase